MFKRTLLFGVFLLTALAVVLVVGARTTETAGGVSSAVHTWADQFAQRAEPEHTPTLSVAQAPEPEPEPQEATKELYAGWGSWCEPMHYEIECKTHKDCEGKTHVSGRNDALKCLHPWWAEKGSDLRICNPGGASRTERRWRYARLRELVGQAYFDETEHCEWAWEVEENKHGTKSFNRVWADGKQMHHQNWRCQREWARAKKLTDFLWVPYKRETSARPFKRHRLDPDAAANAKAWVKEASVYGWKIELACAQPKRTAKNCPRYRHGPMKGKRMLYVKSAEPDPEAEQVNPHYGEEYRWSYGLGPVGKNTGYGVQDWDIMAPPEVLCLEVPGIEASMRDIRGAVKVYRGTRPPTCDGEPYRGRAIKIVEDENGEKIEVEVDAPSWYDVHRVASAGAWCPKKSAKATKLRRNFTKQMKARGLRPAEPVTEAMVGNPIPKEGQIQRATELLAHLDSVLPSPW